MENAPPRHDLDMAKILLVDDEILSRVTVRKILERREHRIVEATNGLDGLRKFRADKFDLVITDIVMPDMEGIEMIAEMKRIASDTRIIAMSGGGRTRNLDFLKMAEERGARKILAKPFTQNELLGIVDAVLIEP